MTDQRRTAGDVATQLLDRLPLAHVHRHGQLLEAELDPAATPAQGIAALRALAPPGQQVHVHRHRRFAVLMATVGRCTVRLTVHRDGS